MRRTRKTPKDRKDEIVTAALELTARQGWRRVSRESIADACGISGSAVTYHFRTMAQLERCVMRAAVRQECLPVVAQGLAVGDTHARKASESLKARARASIA